MYKLNITEKAEQDVLDNALYIKNVLHSEIAANNLVDRFYKTIQKLVDYPQYFPLVNNDLLKPYGIRFLQIKNFTVFFNIEEENKNVFVLRFIYSRRNWKELLGDEFLTTAST
jgi:toxin ParE1/3/4